MHYSSYYTLTIGPGRMPGATAYVRAMGHGPLTAAGLGLAVLLGAACGSGGGEPPSSAADASTTLTSTTTSTATPPPSTAWAITEFDVPAGSHPHDVAVAADGTVWYTAQHTGELGRLDPTTKQVTEIDLGDGSSPHGVIIGPDGAPWITDGGLDAIVRVAPDDGEVTRFDLPPAGRGNANLNTAAFDRDGILWFTGQSGIYGRLDPTTNDLQVFDAPKGRGPYGITVTPSNEVFYASLAGDHLARIDRTTNQATVLEPPTQDNGTRRAWTDSRNRIWTSQWDSGQVAVHDPAADGTWREWKLPGTNPQAYAVYVDGRDAVWLTDFGANAIVRFDPTTESFTPVPLPTPASAVRQLHGRNDEVWGAASAVDKLVVVRPATDTGGD